LTWFGADLFIPPNKLDIKGSTKKLAEIYKHPALLATFCVITGLYILALVRARRKDRKDITKVNKIKILFYCFFTSINHLPFHVKEFPSPKGR